MTETPRFNELMLDVNWLPLSDEWRIKCALPSFEIRHWDLQHALAQVPAVLEWITAREENAQQALRIQRNAKRPAHAE